MNNMQMHFESKLFRLPILNKFSAIVLGRHCFTKYSVNNIPQIIIDHELVHQKQMDKHGVTLFYFLYLKEYLVNLIKYRNHLQAYKNISFEVEAYGA